MKTKTYEIGEDRVVKYNKKKEELSISDKKTGKEALFTIMRWASFRQCMDEVDDHVRRLLQEKDVAYRYHYGGEWHVSVTTGFKCVDLRKWYVRIGETERKPTRTGIGLRLSEWLKLKQVVEQLHRDYPNITEYTPCFLTHLPDFVGCIGCNPYPLVVVD